MTAFKHFTKILHLASVLILAGILMPVAATANGTGMDNGIATANGTGTDSGTSTDIGIATHIGIAMENGAVTDKSRLRLVAGVGSGLYIGSTSYMGFVWYRDKERVPFHFYNDGRAWLQMDKFGHAYTAYWESQLTYKALRWAGVDKRRALLWGGPAGFVFQAPIEIFDGMHEGYGFSWWDVVANGVGSVLFTVQEAVFDEQLVIMKFSYSPSIYPRYHHKLGENHFDRFFLDYNGHTYWFSANLRTLTGITAIPEWLQIAYGYSANGMILEFDNPVEYRGEPFPHLDRYRQHLFSLDLDLSRIPARKRWVRILLQTANTIKIPFPAVEFNRVDGIKSHPVYF